jgi:hypothetical protein
MQLSLKQRLGIVRNFSFLYLERARGLAKAGQKDEARSWLRFFFNAEIFELLSDEDFGVLTTEEIKSLAKTLADLRSECHPLDVPDYRTDLQAIRAHLAEISRHIGLQSEQAFKRAA